MQRLHLPEGGLLGGSGAGGAGKQQAQHDHASRRGRCRRRQQAAGPALQASRLLHRSSFTMPACHGSPFKMVPGVKLRADESKPADPLPPLAARSPATHGLQSSGIPAVGIPGFVASLVAGMPHEQLDVADFYFARVLPASSAQLSPAGASSRGAASAVSKALAAAAEAAEPPCPSAPRCIDAGRLSGMSDASSIGFSSASHGGRPRSPRWRLSFCASSAAMSAALLADRARASHQDINPANILPHAMPP